MPWALLLPLPEDGEALTLTDEQRRDNHILIIGSAFDDFNAYFYAMKRVPKGPVSATWLTSNATLNTALTNDTQTRYMFLGGLHERPTLKRVDLKSLNSVDLLTYAVRDLRWRVTGAGRPYFKRTNTLMFLYHDIILQHAASDAEARERFAAVYGKLASNVRRGIKPLAAICLYGCDASINGQERAAAKPIPMCAYCPSDGPPDLHAERVRYVRAVLAKLAAFTPGQDQDRAERVL